MPGNALDPHSRGAGPTTDDTLRTVPASDAAIQGQPRQDWVNRSGTIGTGGMAQEVAAANTSRIEFLLQNVSNGDLWVDVSATAVQSQPSHKIAPDGIFHLKGPGNVPSGAISIIGATTGQAFSAKEA